MGRCSQVFTINVVHHPGTPLDERTQSRIGMVRDKDTSNVFQGTLSSHIAVQFIIIPNSLLRRLFVYGYGGATQPAEDIIQCVFQGTLASHAAIHFMMMNAHRTG
jgi:hypothetical protein